MAEDEKDVFIMPANDTPPPSSLKDELLELRKRKLIAEIESLKKKLHQLPPKQNWFARNVSLLTFLLASIGVPIGLWQYFEKAESEYKRPLWEKQLNYYFEATHAAATLAVLRNEEAETSQVEWQKARIRFWELYYGESLVVEDPAVSQAMVDFGKCLREYDLNRCDQKQLKQLSINLALVCRDSIGKSWKQPMEVISRKPE